LTDQVDADKLLSMGVYAWHAILLYIAPTSCCTWSWLELSLALVSCSNRGVNTGVNYVISTTELYTTRCFCATAHLSWFNNYLVSVRW